MERQLALRRHNLDVTTVLQWTLGVDSRGVEHTSYASMNEARYVEQLARYEHEQKRLASLEMRPVLPKPSSTEERVKQLKAALSFLLDPMGVDFTDDCRVAFVKQDARDKAISRHAPKPAGTSDHYQHRVVEYHKKELGSMREILRYSGPHAFSRKDLLQYTCVLASLKCDCMSSHYKGTRSTSCICKHLFRAMLSLAAAKGPQAMAAVKAECFELLKSVVGARERSKTESAKVEEIAEAINISSSSDPSPFLKALLAFGSTPPSGLTSEVAREGAELKTFEEFTVFPAVSIVGGSFDLGVFFSDDMSVYCFQNLATGDTGPAASRKEPLKIKSVVIQVWLGDDDDAVLVDDAKVVNGRLQAPAGLGAVKGTHIVTIVSVVTHSNVRRTGGRKRAKVAKFARGTNRSSKSKGSKTAKQNKTPAWALPEEKEEEKEGVDAGAVTPHGSAEAWADALCVDVYTVQRRKRGMRKMP